jgi:hypothetical protein
MSVDPPEEGLQGLQQCVEFLRARIRMEQELEAKRRASDEAYTRLSGRRKE